MSRKHRRKRQSEEPLPEPTDWSGQEDAWDEADIPFPEQDQVDYCQPITTKKLLVLADNIERGIRDLPVWKNLVARVGLKEARKILRRGLFINRITDGNPGN